MEGPFRRSAERTLRVLRASAPHLLRLLGAALEDPLVDWDADAAAKAAQKVGLRMLVVSRSPLDCLQPA